MNVSALDLSVLLGYLALTVLFGLWVGRGSNSATDYLLGGRDLPWWLLLLSIVATETSTVTFLSVPGLSYGDLPGTTGDLRFLQLPLGLIVGRALAAWLLLPAYFRGEMFTAYDVLRVRSGPAVKNVASATFLVMRTLADGLRLYLTAQVVQLLFGCSLPLAVAVIGGATLVYTLFGGIRSVVWNDAVQFAVYIGGALLALWVLDAGLPDGLGAMLVDAERAGRLRTFAFEWSLQDGNTFGAGLIGGAVLSLGTHGVDQLIVQRFLSARSLRDARLALVCSGPIVLVQFALFLLLGLALSAFYAQHPPAEPFRHSDRVFAHFIVHHLPQGAVGVVLGAVFAAAMSTLSSSLSASASALTHDFVLPALGRRDDERLALRIARTATAVFAALQIAVGISGLGGGDAVVSKVLTIQSDTTGVILGLFALALTGAGARASQIGLAAGLATLLSLVFVLPACSAPVHYLWHGVAIAAATVAAGVVARGRRRYAAGR